MPFSVEQHCISGSSENLTCLSFNPFITVSNNSRLLLLATERFNILPADVRTTHPYHYLRYRIQA
jgi:hypothetical protein